MDAVLILFLSVIVDVVLGEPPRVAHPVVWMGKVVSFLERDSTSQHPAIQFLYGTFMTMFTIALFALPVYYLLVYLKSVSFAAYIAAGTLLLKPAFSLRELRQAALVVKNLLTKDKLDEARHELRALVKRDTQSLPKPLLVSATVESVAENTSDSFVAPLFYFLLLGVPGAIGYRVVNTLDAMIGYHGKYEHLGKFAARLDDVLNLVPARLTALLLIAASFILKKNGRASWRIAFSEHAVTESPNAGWPIAAAAGALDVQLEKVGYYKLGVPNEPLVPETIDTSLGLAQTAMFSWTFICLMVSGVIELVIKA